MKNDVLYAYFLVMAMLKKKKYTILKSLACKMLRICCMIITGCCNTMPSQVDIRYCHNNGSETLPIQHTWLHTISIT